MNELFAIVRAGSGELLWAGMTSTKNAEDRAVMAAVSTGRQVNLLSGAELGKHLINLATAGQKKEIN